MSDLILGARLEAKGGSLVGQLDAAEIAARGLEGALEGTGQEAKRLDQAVDGVGQSTTQATGKARALEDALEDTGRAARSAEAGTDALAGGQRRLAVASATATASAARQRAGYQQLGFQMQDVFQQVALGINPLVILAQQGGQTASAIALMGDSAEGSKSRFVKFATFLSGPWGAALFGAVTIVGFLVQSMLEAGDAAEEGEDKAYNFAGGLDVLTLAAGDAKAAMDQLANSLRSAIVLQGSFIRGEAAIAKQKADQLQEEIRADTEERAALRAKRGGLGATLLPQFFGPSADDLRRERELTQRIDANRRALPSALQASASGALAVAQRNVEESFDPLLGKIREVDEEIAKLNARYEQTKRGDDPLSEFNISDDDYNRQFSALYLQRKSLEEQQREGRRNPRNRRGSVDRSRDQLKSFGESATEKVNRVLAEYDPAPRGLDKALQDLRELDKLIVELGERKPPGFEETIKSASEARKAVEDGLAGPIRDIKDSFTEVPRDMAAAGAAMADLDAIAARLKEAKPPNIDELLAQIDQARGAVEDSLVRPFRDILRDQERGIELQRLAAEGRYEEADQLAFIHDLMRQVGAESEDQLATELAKRGVTADMLEQMIANLGIERQLSEEASRRLAIQQEHLREVETFRGNIERFFADIPQRGLKALGDFAKNVQDQVSDYFARYLTETLFGGVFRQIEDQMTGRDQMRKANVAYVRQVGDVVYSLRALENAANDAAVAQGGEILVNGPKGGDEQTDPFDYRMKSPKELFRDIIGPLLKELGIDEDLANSIGEKVGSALEGAVIGQSASRVLLGDKGSSTGAAIGGALGKVAGEEVGKIVGGTLGKFLGPLGSVAGGILGSLVGGLFKKKPSGSTVITGAGDGGFSVSGNKAEVRDSLSAASSSVQAGLNQIAQMLDAEVGSFNVSIGQYKDYFRVSASGSSSVGSKKFPKKAGSDLIYDGQDAQAAVEAALRNALEDGAIEGVSAAVKRALLSTNDIEAAVREALAVKDVEDLLSGMADDYVKELRAFEKVAEERLRIGREYGFDLIELEKHNAEERAKLIDDILQSRVGALKDLLDDLKFGDLAEGTLAERRATLLDEIAKAEDAAAAGEDGAAAQLAALQRDLIALSYEAYGTAGAEYGADRDQAVSSAERIIALEEERVRNAQAEVTDRLDMSNAIANEGNDILAAIRAGIDRLGQLPAGTFTGSPALDTARQVQW